MRKNMISTLLSCCWLFMAFVGISNSVSSKQKELVYLQIVTTNGFFNPLNLYPNDENTESDFPNELGELTKLGKIQHFELGKMLRNYYRHFITSSPVEVDAFSSEEDRSTHSMLCLLASLYAPNEEWEFLPGFHWQPIPVSYLENNDTFFRYKEDCPREIMEREEMYKSPMGQNILNQDKFYYSFWANGSGAEIQNWNNVAQLYDILDREKTLGLKVPKWAEKYWDHFKRISDSAYGWNYGSLPTLQLKVGPLVDLMTVRMRAKVYKPDLVKVSVYMTHDWNLAALMSSMGIYNGLRPPPCATIAIEMYRNMVGQYNVRMRFFNSTTPELGHQEPHDIKLRKCAKYCPLNTFVDHFRYFIPEDFGRLCNVQLDSKSDFSK